MHKIGDDTTTADAQDEFTEGDVILGVPATDCRAPWLTTIQRELVAVVEDAGITLDPLNDTQLLDALGGSGGQASLVNGIVNGEFYWWQRSGQQDVLSIGSTKDYHGPDRWLLRADLGGGAGVAHFRRIEGTVAGSGQPNPLALPSIVPDPESVARTWLEIEMVTPSNGGRGPVIETRLPVEQWPIYLHSICTLSFYAEKTQPGTGSFDATIDILIDNGTGGVPAGPHLLATKAITLNQATQRFELTFDFITSLFVTTPTGPITNWGPDSFLIFRIYFPDGEMAAGNKAIFANFQFGISGTAKKWARRTPEQELALCQYFYQKSYPVDVAPGTTSSFAGESTGYNGAGTQPLGLNQRFPTVMRAAPAITWYNPNTGAANSLRWGGVDVTVTGTSASPSQGQTGAPNITPSQPAGHAIAQWVADAEI